MSSYQEIYQGWKDNPEKFWATAADDLTWFRPWDKVFDKSEGLYGRWFKGATTNTCYNCLDRHVKGSRPGQPAIIYDSPVTNTIKTYSYQDLLDEVKTFAGVLRNMGVEKGDRVIIYMPMIPETIIGMLACARIGAMHSVVFGGFAAKELATRIDDAKPKMILSASCGIEPNRVVAYKPLLDEAIELAKSKPDNCIVFQREQSEATLISGRDADWQKIVDEGKQIGLSADCVELEATDPLYILYTSGTTGIPKGVVRDNGGHMVALNWSMKNIYNVNPGEVYWAASDVGWVVGHSYIVYAPLLYGCTTVVFEGKPVGTPDAGVFWRVIQEHDVTTLFTAPTAFRAIKREDPKGELIGNYNLSRFRSLFLAGERADPDTIKWAEDKLHVPVIDHWWQTETAWAIAANPMGIEQMEVKYGSSTVAMPGYELQILNNEQDILPNGEIGNLCIKLPLPPGCLPTLWEKDDRFKESYLTEFPGYYQTADAGYIDDDNYLYIMERTDDIINVAGHRLSTGGIEEVIANHADIAEVAVLGVKDTLKGQLPVAFIVLNVGVNIDISQIENEVVKLVRKQIGPVAALKKVLVVARLPKTRSGKILRGTMRKIADQEKFNVPAIIDDPIILDEITEALKAKGML